MSAFRFPLEKVLAVREFETMAAQQELVEARRASAEANAALDQARRARLAFADDLTRRRKQGMAAWEWAATTRQYEQFCRAEEAATASLHRALEVTSSRQIALEEAMQREEALRKLESRHREAFRYAELKAEQDAMDEIAGLMRLEAKGAM